MPGIRHFISSLLAVAMLTAMVACDPPANRFSSCRNIDIDQGWAYADTLAFFPDHADSVATGAYWVCVRHNNNYPYANLWLELSYADDRGETHTDTLNMPLADTYGRWKGQRLGLKYQQRIKATGRVTHVIGTPLKLRHIMRVDTIRDIDLVGLEFIGDK